MAITTVVCVPNLTKHIRFLIKTPVEK